ncbi:hypothetical protein [Candidatus Thiodiazotropha sp. CDECU1]|nr:hypothetical protein [Candidatus Thiodiazotropha sp. CDECU1]
MGDANTIPVNDAQPERKRRLLKQGLWLGVISDDDMEAGKPCNRL